MFGLGIWELLIILVIVLLIFGGSRLPKIGHALGESLRELKKTPDYMSGEAEAPEDESKPSVKRDNLADLKDIVQLGTKTGRRNILGRFLGKRF
jgi:sec-independent protein translocase protein TatA